ncbi:MAG TPA: isoprenylcysteine carboxylmethyltransferase family protein [Steroidobacteraceae bacterium]|jgi:protein-S-isoprenylcysteine O-methyltransferase Ste14|nr:isoprenylcysteine carboxylmethyltransferase family protein [Steroidobacteraceae bacterium]
MPRLLLYRQLITLLWLAWALYWIVSAANSKTTRRRESLGSRLAHILPLILGGVLLAGNALPWRGLHDRLWPRSLTAYWIGVALLAAGLAFTVWARVHLGRNWSGSVTVKEGHELIRSGPYRYVRHPIYTGLLAALLGSAIASGTVRAVLGLLIIAAALLRKLRVEERFMRETFPGEYQRYSEQTPALIPFTKFPRSAPR